MLDLEPFNFQCIDLNHPGLPIHRSASQTLTLAGSEVPHVMSLLFSNRGSSGSMPVASISYLHCLLPRVFASIRYIVFICISIYSIVQRVGAVEVLMAVVRQLGAKLASMDRGQASRVSV